MKNYTINYRIFDLLKGLDRGAGLDIPRTDLARKMSTDKRKIGRHHLDGLIDNELHRRVLDTYELILNYCHANGMEGVTIADLFEVKESD